MKFDSNKIRINQNKSNDFIFSIKPDNTFVQKPIVESTITNQFIKPNIYKEDVIDAGNIVKNLYNANYASIANKGFDDDKTKRLATILTQQQMLESG